MKFEEALSAIKRGMRVRRGRWDREVNVRINKGRYKRGDEEVLKDLIEKGLDKYYKASDTDNCEIELVMNIIGGIKTHAHLSIEDLLAEDWEIVGLYNAKEEGDLLLNCMEAGGCKAKEKVRHTLEGVIVDLGKGGDAKDQIRADENYPDYVCIKGADLSCIKSGSILRFLSTNKDSNLIYYYKNSNGYQLYIGLEEIKEKVENYQELRKTNYEVVDEWHVRFMDKEKADPYKVERAPVEEDKNVRGDCKENFVIGKGGKCQDFVVIVEEGVKEIHIEEGGKAIKIVCKKEESFIPKKYIGRKMGEMGKKGNFNDIWVEQRDGSYACKGKSFTINKGELESDVRNGYLVKIDN